MTAVSFQFGEFELDCVRFELRRNGHPLRLERKPLELLILLASSGGRLVSREEIARCLWPSEVFVDTEHGINTAIRKIRHALRENPDRPRFLETVTGKGYRFTGATEQPIKAAPPPLPTLPPASHTQVDAPAPPHPAAPHSGTTSSRRLWLTVTAAAVLLIGIVILTVGARRIHGHPVQPAATAISPAAREAYLHGRYLWFSDQEPSAGEYFLKATQLAPTYAPAWADLANYYGAGMVDGDFDPRQNLSLEDASAHRAEQLDDSLPETHLALAASDWIVDWNYPQALHELDHAIQQDPRFSEALHLRAKLLGQLNRHDEAIASQRAAMDINPLERPWALAFFLLRARRWDACIAEAQQRLQGHPNTFTWGILSQAYRAKGMENEAENAAEQSFIYAGNASAAEAIHRAFARGGYHAVLLWQLDNLQSRSQKHYVPPFLYAKIYAQLGRNPMALAALDDALREHSPMILDLQNDTAFDKLHADPHYRAIVQKIGLPPAW